MSVFNSRDCVDIDVEIRGGGCRRPLTGKLLESAKAQRALLEETKRRYGADVEDPRDGDANGQ